MLIILKLYKYSNDHRTEKETIIETIIYICCLAEVMNDNRDNRPIDETIEIEICIIWIIETEIRTS